MMQMFKLVLCAILLSAMSAVSYCAEPSFSLTISLAQERVKAGSEIRVKIVMKNVTDHQIRVPGKAMVAGEDVVPANCHATVTDANGIRPPYTEYGKKMWGDHPLEEGHNGNWIFSTMEAGEQRPFTADLILSRLYDLGKPGKYSIQVRYPDPDGGGVVKSNRIVLTVTE